MLRGPLEDEEKNNTIRFRAEMGEGKGKRKERKANRKEEKEREDKNLLNKCKIGCLCEESIMYLGSSGCHSQIPFRWR